MARTKRTILIADNQEGHTLERHAAELLKAALAEVKAGHRPRLLLVTGADRGAEQELAVAAGAETHFAASVRRRPLLPFAGLTELFAHLYNLAVTAGRPDLAEPHWYELPLVVPSLAGRIPPRRPAPFRGYRPGETERWAPFFWGRRIHHGLIDFLFAVQDLLGGEPLALGFLGLDEAGPEAREFLALLCRRAARAQRPLLLWVTASGDMPQAWLRTVETQEPAVAIGRLPGNGGRRAAPVSAFDLSRCTVEELLTAAVHNCRHGICADAVDYCRHLLLVMGPEHSQLLPKVQEVLRVGLNTIGAPATVLDLLLIQELNTTVELRRRVELLTYLAMGQAQATVDFDLKKTDDYVERALQTADQAANPAERARYRLIATHGLVLAYARARRFQEALAAGHAALAEMERHWEPEVERARRSMLLNCMGQVAELAGDMEQALALYRRSLEPDPDFPEYYQHLAASLNRVGRYTEALEVCAESAARTPPDWRIHTWRGQALGGLGRYAEALREFDRAETLDPTAREIYLNRGLLHHELGQTQAAVTDYTAYLHLVPNDAEVLCNRGSARHDLGDREGALADLNAALERNPQLLAAWANRAAVLYDLGRVAEALQDLEQALKLDPGNEMLLQNRDALKAELAG